MDYLPVMLNVSDRDVVIIGGGEAAYKKARNLSPHCSSITVIASSFSSGMTEMPVTRVTMEISSLSQVDKFLKGSSIVIIATDDPPLNDMLEAACRQRGLLFNRVDRADSPFIFPATFDVHGAVVSVSTKGKSPSLARFLSQLLRKDIEPYARALPVLERLRSDVALKPMEERVDYFNELLSEPEFWDLVARGQMEDAYEHGRRLAGSR